MGWTNIKYALEDHGIVDKEIRETDMEWTLVKAVRLEFGEEKGAKEVRVLDSKGTGMRMSDSVGVVGVTRFLVKVAVEGSFVREAVVVRD
jgi:hypothetical protein